MYMHRKEDFSATGSFDLDDMTVARCWRCGMEEVVVVVRNGKGTWIFVGGA